MASSSNPPYQDALARMQQNMEYLCTSNANVSNFVSVKLSGDSNYHLWERQMLCLMESYNLRGIVDAAFIRPRALSPEIDRQYDSLVKGWIFGSVSEGLLGIVISLGSAKEVWDKLKSLYDPALISSQQVTEDTEKDVVQTEDSNVASTSTGTITQDKGVVQPVQTKAKGKDEIKGKDKNISRKTLYDAIAEDNWWDVIDALKENKELASEAINNDGNTALHIAVGLGHSFIVGEILSLIQGVQLTKIINLQGSTALHIAAIVGNTEAAELLIKKYAILLDITDHEGETPLDRAYENMHLDTIKYLLKVANDDRKTKKKSSPLKDSISPGVKVGVNLLVNAISAKQYDLAKELIQKFPEFAVENDNVLMAIATTFPSGLNYWETRLHPNMDDVCERIINRTANIFETFLDFLRGAIEYMTTDYDYNNIYISIIRRVGVLIYYALISMYSSICHLIRLLILIVYFPFFMLYFVLWEAAKGIAFSPVEHIEKKMKDVEEAKEVLKLLCDEIDKSEIPDAHPRYYTRPILEAAHQNAYEVVDEILLRSPEAIRYKDKSGYDIIQLSVIHRSEKIYNLIYILWERKSAYRMTKDSSKNNMLHLAGRLAPSHKLKLRRGAAFQLQREVQWRQEVVKLVFPSYITKENIFKETPDMVFTKEHENLVKEGEQWMKAVAESCSITASLITTIVFAAAITVPGGNHEKTGIPVFTDEIAFTIFAIADAISLFASSTALLMFLSILTGRFAEQDFLVSLPRRLIIGLCTLMLSTTTMMVAFGATLYLVFGHKKPWMVAPICLLAFLPIASFGTLQIPLIVDLFQSTYVRIFGQQISNTSHRFNPDAIRLFFGK